MRFYLPLTLSLFVLSALPACSGDKTTSEDEADTDTDTDTDTDSDTDSDTDTDTDTDVDPNAATLTGTIVDATGTPITSGAQIRLCDELCIAKSPDSSGVFVFDEIDPTTQAFEVVMLGGQEEYATPMVPMTFATAEHRELTVPVMVQAFASKETLSSAMEVEIDGDLYVLADPSGMETSLNSPSEDLYLAGVRADLETGLPFENVSGTVVAAWYLGNFESEVEPAWPFSVTDTLGLTEGTILRVYTSSYNEKVWLDGGTATVGAGGIVTDGESGIAMLTTLILVME